ncbi:mechanosensitive ion channel family protein [Flavobacterium sp. 7A]|uniref:mechanosensitive ion channel family protein n=1 Tax=Flavobacterium sp. 7A TaxID=2940571 RepID=UPI002227BDBA|nr:mechanosensitive ion channel family protein [Flavobacterium sp. 7A]MCW2121178.1 small-conductance mechanosensitive channel [Flavobacterium sp. 7A]
MKFISQLFFLLILSQCSYSQTKEQKSEAEKSEVKEVLVAKQVDSTNAVVLNAYNKKLEELEVQRLKDSVQQSKLQSKLEKLSTTDNIQKDKLLKQLQEFADKDKERLEFKKRQIDSLRTTAKSYPVMGFFNDTLFAIYNRLGSFSVKDRAEAVSNRIQKLADIYQFKKEDIQISASESTVDLMVGESILTSISENDAIWNNTTKEELAKKYKSTIENAVIKYQEETSTETLSKEIGLALLVLLVVGIIIFFIRKGFRKLNQKISEQEGKLLKGITIKNYTLFDTSRQVNVFTSISNFLKWILTILTIYLSLPILFGIFPWTKHFTDTLIEYIKSPALKIVHGVWDYLPNLVTIMVIVIFFRYVLRLIHFLKTEVENEKLQLSGFYPDWANPTYQIIKVVLYAFMGIVIFPYLPGSDSPIFQGVSVFLGVLFTFGSSGSLSNVVAGLVLTYMRLFTIGDRVKIGDVFGDVIEKSMLVTRVRTTKNEIISIPNSTVMNSHTINYSSDAPVNGLILHTTVTIGYDVPWKKVHQALIDAANRTELLQKKPVPFVLQTSLDDFYVSYQINGYTKEVNKQALIYSDLHANIQDCCNENGIEILSPHYRAARDGSQSTIPEDYLDKNYKAPKFNISISKEE